MLFCPSEISAAAVPAAKPSRKTASADTQQAACDSVRRLDTADQDDDFVVETISAPSMLGVIENGKAKHYYSSGAFNLIQLVLYVLRQTGPAHIFLCTYSISDRSITTLKNHLDDGSILGIQFLIDNRVRTISPKSFDYLLNAFPGCVRCRTLHAKVALIWNENWHIDIVGSQNATHNPKLERGTIFTQKEVFDFDKKTMLYEFDNGTIERT